MDKAVSPGWLGRFWRQRKCDGPAVSTALPHDLGAVLAFLNSISRACADAPTPEAATTACLAIVGRFTGWPIAHAYRLLADGSGRMASMKDWYLASSDNAARTDAFAASGKAVFAPGQGIIGRVSAEGRAVFCEDVTC